MSDHEQTHYHDDHEYHEGSHGKPKLGKKILKVLIIFAGIIAALIGIVVVGFGLLFVYFLTTTATDAGQAINEAWQSVTSLLQSPLQPFIDMFSQMTKAASNE